MSEKIWSDDAWEDYIYWQTQDKKIVNRFSILVPAVTLSGMTAVSLLMLDIMVLILSLFCIFPASQIK